MKTPLTEAVAAADSQGRFFEQHRKCKSRSVVCVKLSPGLEAAKALTQKADSLVSGAAQAVYNKFPYTTPNARPQLRC